MMYTYNETENAVYMVTGYYDTDGAIILRAPVVNAIPGGFVKMQMQPKHIDFEIWRDDALPLFVAVKNIDKGGM